MSFLFGGSGGSQQAAPQQTTSNVYQTNIPDYAQPYVQNMLNATQAQLFTTDPTTGQYTFNQYQPYSGMDQTAYNNASQAVAGFSPEQQQAFSSAANMQTPGQYGQASRMTNQGIMGSNALAGQNYQLGQQANPQNFQQQVGGYMSPYIQQALAPGLQQLAQQTGINSAGEQAAATSKGAFGGSREALANSLNQQQGNMAASNMIGQGYQNAFNAAQNQYNQNDAFQLQANQAALGALGQGMQGANQLAGIGGQQLGAQQSIANMQNQFGGQQQANAQQIINQGIQNYATAQQYPLMQLGTMSNMLRGLPMQSATTQQYQAAPSALTQTIGAAGVISQLNHAKGGLTKGIKGYLGGGIIDSTEADLNDMPSDALNKELASTQSPTIKNQIKQILQARAGAQYAGGGIIAFDVGGTAASKPSNTDLFFNQLHADQALNTTPPTTPPTTPTNEAEAYRQAAVLNPNSPANPNYKPSMSPEAFAQLQQAISQSTGGGIKPSMSPEAFAQLQQAISQSTGGIKQPAPQAGPQPGPQPGPQAAPPQPGPQAAPPQGGIKQPAAAPTPKVDPHVAVAKAAETETIKNGSDPTVSGFLKPITQEEVDAMVDKQYQKLVSVLGPNDTQAQLDKLDKRQERSMKGLDDNQKLIYAGMFAKMATTPGSVMTAAMTGIQSGIPQLMANNDKRNQVIDNIEDAKSAIAKADRAEKLGLIDTAYKHVDTATKRMMDAQKIYADYAGHEMTYKAAMYGHDVQKQVGLAAAAQHGKSNEINEQLRRDNNINTAATALEGRLAALPKSYPTLYETANMPLPPNADKSMKKMVAVAKEQVANLEAPIRTKKAIFDEQIINRANPNSATKNTNDPFNLRKP